MQSNKLKLTAAAPLVIFQGTGNLFVYESGTSAGNTAILVKPEGGNEIQLKPGQGFRLPPGERAGQWTVRSADGASVINGVVVIGAGEFFDANTNNIVTLAEGFSNNVRVNNTTAERVPVDLDPDVTVKVSLTGTKITNTTAERLPVSLDPAQVLNTSEYSVSYNKTWGMTSGLAQNTPTQILAPAENVNGAILRVYRAMVQGGSSNTLLAKSAAPTGLLDGDVLGAFLTGNGAVTQIDIGRQIIVPAGKGIWVWANTAESNPSVRNALITLL